MQWGTVGEWVSGIGALLAVVAAVGIALFEHRQARQSRQLAEARNLRIEAVGDPHYEDGHVTFSLKLKTYRSTFTDVEIVALGPEDDVARCFLERLRTGNSGGREVMLRLKDHPALQDDPEFHVCYTDQDGNRWRLADDGRLDRV